jgi:hypothetical protein
MYAKTLPDLSAFPFFGYQGGELHGPTPALHTYFPYCLSVDRVTIQWKHAGHGSNSHIKNIARGVSVE